MPLVKKNLQNPSEIKKNTSESENEQFFLKILHRFDRKLVFIRFHSVGPEHCFSVGKFI